VMGDDRDVLIRCFTDQKCVGHGGTQLEVSHASGAGG
jgi:hypothetical protein